MVSLPGVMGRCVGEEEEDLLEGDSWEYDPRSCVC